MSHTRAFLVLIIMLAILVACRDGVGPPAAAPTPSGTEVTQPAPSPVPASRRLAITIDAAETGEPISPYVYGQFIEHQGRCIYGGIWAEMLLDRKFLYPVDYHFPWGEMENRSPWQAMEFDTVVEMDRRHAYTGEHAPRIELDGHKARGIVQTGLGLRQGREYEGYVILMGEGDVGVEVRLVWGPDAEDRHTVTIDEVSSDYTRYPFHFTAGADTEHGRLEIAGQGEGRLWIGTVSLMPADNVDGMRADTLALLRELDATVYRWPGGLFVNDYDWRQAIGDRDLRPPRINRVYWSEDVESNDFGLDEFLAMCEALDAEPYVVVSSSGRHNAGMAAEEVQYLNGSTDTPWGAERAANGHPEPYNVRFWGVGNEMWEVPLEIYVERHNEIAAAMWEVDPSIQLVGVGGLHVPGIPSEEGDWSWGMLTHAGDHMDWLSEHVYSGSSDDLVEHTAAVARDVQHVVEAHRHYREQSPALREMDVRLALDEWNYFWGGRAEIYGEAGPRYFFRDGMGIARGLHAMFRNSDLIFMANTHPVNVHGQIKTTATDAAFEATGLVLQLYRAHFGTLPVAVEGCAEPLDVVAAWSEDGASLTLAVVNPTQEAYELAVTWEGAQPGGTGRTWRIHHADPMAYNEPGRPPQVVIEELEMGDAGALYVAPLSVNVYEIPASSAAAQ